MEPVPPQSTGLVSPLRFHPRGPSHTTSPSHALPFDALVPGLASLSHHQRRHLHHNTKHQQAKVSPRHVKLQSVTAALPVYATTTLRDQIHGHFRHELFQLHQLLQDAVATSRVPLNSNHEALVGVEMQRSGAVLELLTSDHHAAVMREFFAQWQQIRTSSRSSSPPVQTDEQELLCEVVDAIFRNLPTILTEHDVRNAKSFMRLVDALKAMRELILSLLFKTHGSSSNGDDDDDESDDDGRGSTTATTGMFASTASLLAAVGGVRHVPRLNHRQQPTTTVASRPTRVPLYLYCQQLERELETLKRRLRSGRRNSHTIDKQDIGLLDEQTLSLLVQFWELPKAERLAFFCQIASQAKQDDCDSVLRVFVDKCDTGNLLSLWDALQLTPQVQHALASRRHGDDADAAAREAAAALTAANHDVGARHEKRANGSGSGDDDDSSDDSRDGSDGTGARHARRGKRFAMAGRGGFRPSQQQVDLRGLTDVFEHDEKDDDDDVGGSKRRRHKLRIHDRGRSPEGLRDLGAKHSDRRRTLLKGEHEPPPRSTPSTPRPVLDRLHWTLLELLKGDDAELDATVSDAAWRLVETIDKTKRHASVVPRGVPSSPRRLTTFQQHPMVIASGVPLRGGNGNHQSDPLGANLTVDQQYFVKLDQLQSLLASLSGFSLPTMTTDTISNAYKRVLALHRLFHAFQGKVYAAVGLDPVPTATHAVPATGVSPVPPAMAVEETVAAPMWGDDQVMQSVEVMLGKLGKMVRSLAPITDVGGGASGSGGSGSGTTTSASSEILRLAEAMEEIASSSAATSSSSGSASAGRRQLSLDPTRRLAMLNRLKSLAHGNQIESLTGLLASTGDDLAALKAVTEHQQRQLEEITSSDLEAEFCADDGDTVDGSGGMGDSGTGSRGSIGNGDVDDVLKLVKKAKIRRASAAKLAAAKDGAAGVNGHSDATATAIHNIDDDDERSLLMNPMTAPRFANRVDIPLTIKQATAQRGSKLFNAGILLRVVDQMYREHYETMVASLQYGSRRMEFSEFMYDWHIRKYGLKALAQQHLLKLIQSLRKHERKIFPCHLCLRFLGIVRPLGFHEHKFVLGLLDKWSSGTFSGATKHRVEFVPRQFKVRVTYAIATLQDALSERFGVYFRGGDAVAGRVRARAMRSPDDEYIKESELLAIALDEWQVQRTRIEQILEAVYAAGDLNGDGSLELDEFSAVMLHLSPSLTDKFVQRVFTAAHDFLKPRRISFARFLDVVLLERVLNTSHASAKGRFAAANGNSNSSGANANATVASATATLASVAPTTGSSTSSSSSRSSSEEDEEMYQFNMLQETWEHDRDVVAQALSAIPHAPTVASLTFRVTFLTQILSKRVDSKTAWMCHRQIMREIRRYQNLNDDQIVAVKTKEETFKKAVLAIRNLQRLSVAFRRPTAVSKAEGDTNDETNDSVTPPQRLTSSDDRANTNSDDATGIDREHHDRDHHHGPDELQKMTSYVSVVEGALAASTADGGTARLVDMEALEEQLREKFLERADEGAIDDFKSALQTIRRLSVQTFPVGFDVEQLRDSSGDTDGMRHARERGLLSLPEVLEADDEQDDEDDYEEEDDAEEEDGDGSEGEQA